MSKNLTRLGLAIVSGLFVIALAVPVSGQTVNVTFTANTSTNPDTLSEEDVLQIRGAVNDQTGAVLPDGTTITWDSASELIMDNRGGDYWTTTIEMTSNDTLKYKYWAGFDLETGASADWESGINNADGIEADNNRVFIAGASDTTLPLEFFNGTGQQQDQFWRPFETKEDSIAIYFRVNLAGVTEAELFDPAVNGPVGVRGNPETSGGTLDWGQTRVQLTREESSVIDGSFWSGVAYVDKDSVTAGSEQAYKFFIESDGGIDWEGDVNPLPGIENRIFTYTETLVTESDTTLHWVHFDNRVPQGVEPIESQVTFRVSTEALEDIELFDRALDRIAVIGAKGWDRPDDFIELTFTPAIQEWAGTSPISAIPGTEIRYKYFVVYDTSRTDPNSPNFIPNLQIQTVNSDNDDSGWEEPSVTGGGDRVLEFQNAASQSPPGDFGFDRQFFASVPANAVIEDDISVTFNVDMTPATDPNSNSEADLFTPGTDSVFVQMDGSMLALSQGFTTFGSRVVELKDDDGDMIYSGTWDLTGPAWYQFGFVIAYSTEEGSFIINGGGFSRGRRYYQFVEPLDVADDGTTTWPTEFSFPVIEWVEDNLPVAEPPNLTEPTSVAGPDDGVVKTFALHQNYPNPFNPETTIRYQVATPTEVKIQVYNLVGQLVNTLVDKKLAAGDYSITWQGDDFRGQAVSSGIYFLKMKAGDFNKVRKMALVR
ncbi:T9SS type A sorting domain-containing protein [candidate division KSB1 bacterium]|nr:T9SS type A sorting domain-containing protein [candidate division KSB1 bacterium]NIR69431.1 T9SS type A sorting domain-containing protein [candidate division KSB1 bacterium]NIS22785.1 T9SS type A sorting domain-containing protein [candidate division KSB1 bacterium]NIT69625.1 T9SS type A sorting domain-containing protein [candidate division KSB1 bacterium]NIU23294.1 T9SS type A sorting domain-containing protein [candidate division KSB1 bacterium]